MKFVKKTAALLAALACIAAFASCAGSAGNDAGNGAETASKSPRAEEADRVPYVEPTGEDVLAEFGSADFGGYEFRIMTSSRNRFVAEEDSAGLLNPAIAERNALLEERFNFKIREIYCKDSDFLSNLSASVGSGRQVADAVSFQRSGVSAAAAGNLLMNLYSVPYLQTDMAYLDTALVEKCTAKNELYVVYEPSSLFYSDLMCVVYNRALIGGGYDTVYVPARDGEWYYDSMLELAETAAYEVMRKRSPDTARDTFGIVSLYEKPELLHESFLSSGYALFGDTFHREIEYNADLETADAVAKGVSALYSSKCFMNADPDTAAKAFREGRAAFAVCRVSFIAALENSTLDWGVAPFPKLTKDQDSYYSCISDTACGISVPECQTDPARTGKILTLLFASSSVGLEEAFWKDLTIYTLHDNASALLLKEVFGSPVTDMTILYYQGESRLPGLGRDTILEAVQSGKSFESLTSANAIALREMNALDFK